MGESEQLRLRYKYRRLIVQGDLRMRRDAATPLVGPDCAYHLYAWENGTAKEIRAKNRPSGPPPGQQPD